MTNPDIGPEQRLYRTMQDLLTTAAHEQLPEIPAARNAVTREDALDAVLQLAAIIDDTTQEERWPAAQGVHGAAMLMIIREYIKALPPELMPDGTDRATSDLTELAGTLRRQHGEAGVQG
jgi:hypothetical protein